MIRQSGRQSSFDINDPRFSRPGNTSLSIRQPDASFLNRPPTQTSQRTTFHPPVLQSEVRHLSQDSVAFPGALDSKHVRFDSRGSQIPTSSVRYSNVVPPGAIPAHQFQPVNLSSRRSEQYGLGSLAPTSNIFAEHPIHNQSYAVPYNHQPQIIQQHVSYTNPPLQPYHDTSHIVPVPVIPTGPSYMRNSALITSGLRASALRGSNQPRYMTNDQYIERPPPLSYIDNSTTTCPIWIWALLGTLALIGIVLTLVIVGKKSPNTFKITKIQNVTQKVTPIVVPEVNKTQITTVVNQTKIEEPKPPENVTTIIEQTKKQPEVKIQQVKNQTIPPIPVVPVVPVVPQKSQQQKLKQQLIKQQNSTITDQQKQLEAVKSQLQRLKNLKTTVIETNVSKQLISNPSTTLPVAPPVTQQKGSAIDVVECEPGYYPYGGICFPCKNGVWNGTNCIKTKQQEQKDEKEAAQKQQIQKKQKVCPEGFFLKGGKCLSCPSGSVWNGKNCVKKVVIVQKVENKKEEDKNVHSHN